jgi:hypothetical protein
LIVPLTAKVMVSFAAAVSMASRRVQSTTHSPSLPSAVVSTVTIAAPAGPAVTVSRAAVVPSAVPDAVSAALATRRAFRSAARPGCVARDPPTPLAPSALRRARMVDV